MRRMPALTLIALPLALAACGGGGATGSATPPAPASSGPGSGTSGAQAIAQGRVVDESSGAPLAGVRVALEPFTTGAGPVAATTTDANGNFALGGAASTYLLVVGSDSPSDTSRATPHVRVQSNTGTTTVSAPAPAAAPNVTYTGAQLAGALRLATLSSDEADCLNGAQAGRASLKLSGLVEDELLLEDARAHLQEMFAQDTDEPSPLYPDPSHAQFVFSGLNAIMHSEADFPSCSSWSGTAYSYVPSDPYSGAHPPYPQASNPAYILYGTAFALKGNASISHASYGAQLYATDPRT